MRGYFSKCGNVEANPRGEKLRQEYHTGGV